MSRRVFNVNARSNTRRGRSSRTLIKGIQKVFLDLKNQQYIPDYFFLFTSPFLTFSMKILILLESILIYVKTSIRRDCLNWIYSASLPNMVKDKIC